MQRNIFPLQANGYYLNRQGKVVKLQTCDYAGWLKYDATDGVGSIHVQIHNGRYDIRGHEYAFDIMDIAMVVGQKYRLRGTNWNGNPRYATVTTVYPEDDFRNYPVLAEESYTHASGQAEVMYHSLTRNGYYYSDYETASADIMDIAVVVGPSYANTQYNQVYKRRQQIGRAHV